MTDVDRLTDMPLHEQAYRLMVDNPRDVIYRSSADHRLVWISDSVTETLGWAPDELIGTDIDAIVHPDDIEATMPTRLALRAGIHVSEAASGEGPPLRIRASDGTYRWASVIALPITTSDGEPDGIVGRLRDVHDSVLAREEVRAAQELTTNAFDKLLDPLLILKPIFDDAGQIIDLEYIEANPAACAYNRMSHEQMVGSRLLELNPGNVESGVWQQLIDVYTTGVPLVLDGYAYDQELFDGERRYYDLRVTRGADLLVYTWRDVTDRRRAEVELAEREDLYRLVTEDVTDAVVRFDGNANIVWASPSIERLTGFTADELRGTSGLDLLPPDDADVTRQHIHERRDTHLAGADRIRMRTADGSVRWVDARSRPFIRYDGASDGFVAVLRDVTAEVDAQALRDHEIGHDALTGLANRGLALARIDRTLQDLVGSRGFIAVLGVGVDRLTTVNQALSYAAGDLVLTTIAGRLSSAVGDPDRVARVAGDEFLVLLTNLRSPAEAARTAQQLVEAAQGVIELEGQRLAPTVSIGVAIGERGDTSEELMRKAGLAVRQAKEAGRNRWQFVDPQLAAEAQVRLRVEEHLRDVLRDGRVAPWFQPVVTLADRRLVGFEALVRINEDSGRFTAPGEFLPVAESTGQIIEIDRAVLHQAIDLLSVVDVGHIAINVSPPTLAIGDYAERLVHELDAVDFHTGKLRLEVTETALLGVSPTIAKAMRDIADLGVRWYVDDFGTGFSSISHLRDLPVTGLKLDQSFTAGIRNGDRTCIKLSQGLIGLAEGLGLDTVAEGIETEFEAGALLGQGWNLGQGWLFGRPVPRSALVE